jgi:hypothetical protein
MCGRALIPNFAAKRPLDHAEGEIHHRSLAIEENAWFAGASRPKEALASEDTDQPSPIQLVPTDGSHQINASREVHAERGID